LYSKAISLSGLSKTYGLAGLRIGWLAIKDDLLMQKMKDFKDYTTICNSAPSEILGLIALRHKEKLIEINLKKILHNLAHLEEFILNHNDSMMWQKPKAGTIGLVRLNIDISSLNFCEKIVNETGIMVVPSEMFDFGNKHIRVGFGRENFTESLRRFEDFLINLNQ